MNFIKSPKWRLVGTNSSLLPSKNDFGKTELSFVEEKTIFVFEKPLFGP